MITGIQIVLYTRDASRRHVTRHLSARWPNQLFGRGRRCQSHSTRRSLRATPSACRAHLRVQGPPLPGMIMASVGLLAKHTRFAVDTLKQYYSRHQVHTRRWNPFTKVMQPRSCQAHRQSRWAPPRPPCCFTRTPPHTNAPLRYAARSTPTLVLAHTPRR